MNNELPTLETVREMVAFYDREDLPQVLQINGWEKINNMKKFSEQSINCMRDAYKRKAVQLFYSYYDKLIETRKVIEAKTIIQAGTPKHINPKKTKKNVV